MSEAEARFAGTKPVEERHRIDEAALTAWMEANAEGFEGPLSVSQFKGGQSNPTYRLDAPSGAYVLRRKPFGNLLPSAHAVDREFRVISALSKQGFPVAKPYGLCEDTGVIGAMFYVMGMVEGPVYWDGALPEKSPADRRAIYEAQVSTLARLHNYDPDAIGLGDYGKPGNYFERQIQRWIKQYRASETEHIGEMERLIEFLPGSIPEQERVSVVHGDYRIDNMIFRADRHEIAAVLDWELSTLGDPLADFTYFLMNWNMPVNGRAGLAGLDLPALGIPSMEETAALYCRLTDRPALENLDWYFAYNLFRMAGIIQGIAGRVRDGTAASAQAVEMAKMNRPLAEAGWMFAQKAGA